MKKRLQNEPNDLCQRKFGLLTPLQIVAHKPVVWECKCKCGNVCQAVAADLTSGHKKSCGCFRRKTCGDRVRKRPYEWLYNILKSKGVQKGKWLDLSFEEFLEFTKITTCHYCWETVVWRPHDKKSGSAYNLDCKDNILGYTKLNLVVCCGRCNAGKSDKFTYNEWVEIGKCIRAMREKSVGVGA